MHTLQDANDSFFHLLQSFAVLMSERADDIELGEKAAFQCDEEIRTLRSVQQALERRVALVCQKRNTFATINTLPPELLINVFAITTSNSSGTDSSDNATLSLVCRYWNRLVETTPSLWTRIVEATMSVAKIIRTIEKSRNAPLEIICLVAGPQNRDGVLNEIFRHAHRWRDVRLALGNTDQGLDVITTSSMPLLESLSLSRDGYLGWARSEPLDLFGGRAPPRLQKLCLGGIPVPWSPTILCHLTSLSISQIRDLGPSLDQLMAVLSACPDLESLSISEVSFSGASSPHSIHLPALVTLELRTLTTPITNRLLASIHAPNCISGDLHCDIQGDPLQTLFTSDISHFFDLTRSNPGTGSISCTGDRFNINLMGPWSISIYVENMTLVKDTLTWLSPQSRVQLITYSQSQSLDGIVAVAGDMEAIYRIVFGYEAPVSEALTLLATCSLVQGRTRWPFPALEEISIGSDIVDDGDELEKLLLMLRRRKEAQETQDNAQHPKPIRKLGLGWSDWDTDDYNPAITDFSSAAWPNGLDEVRRLLGPEGELKWYGRVVTEEGVLEH